MNWLGFAVRNTLRNRRRSIATVSIAALGSTAILVASGFAQSTYDALAQVSARSTGHLIVARADQFKLDEETPLQHGIDNPKEVQRALLADPAVRRALPRISFSGLISNGEKSVVMVGNGVEPDGEMAVKAPLMKLVAGSLLKASATQSEVILGDALARSLKAVPGTGLTLLASTTDGALNAVDVRVTGVISTGTPELDRRVVLTDIATAQRLLVTERVSTIGVYLDGMADIPGARERIAKALPALATETWLDQAVMYKSVRSLYNIIFGAMGLIIGVIVVFVVSNAMSSAIIERTREIGNLRAMGTSRPQLTRSLSLEGMVLGGTGAVTGAAIALGIATLLHWVPVNMPPPPGRSVGYPLVIATNPALYAAVLVAMVAMSMAASAWVARRTVGKPIVDALAHT